VGMQPVYDSNSQTVTAGGLAGGSVGGGSRNGQIPPANVASANGMLVPTNSDVSPTTKVQIQTGVPIDSAPAVPPPAKTAGAIDLGLPLDGSGGSVAGTAAAPAGSVNVASIPEGTTTSDAYRVWIGTFKTENDALIFWAQELQRFPDLMKSLKLTIRQVDLGGSQGIWYRVLGGPFGNRQGADQLCNNIKARSPSDDCRVVIN
jgi:hypothetical protein